MFKKLFGALKRTFTGKEKISPAPTRNETELDREISALYSIVIDAMGSDRLVLQAGKMDALRFLRSNDPGERILALRRILEENPTIGPPPSKSEIPAEIVKLSELMADILMSLNLLKFIVRRLIRK